MSLSLCHSSLCRLAALGVCFTHTKRNQKSNHKNTQRTNTLRKTQKSPAPTMKFINIAFPLLFVASSNAASINKQFDEQVAQSYLRKSDRNVPGSPEDWLQAVNDARTDGQGKITWTSVDENGNWASSVSVSILDWSADLANQAQGWANTLAASCKNAVPNGEENPGDYGVTTILNARNPVTAVKRWMINGKLSIFFISLIEASMTLHIWLTILVCSIACLTQEKMLTRSLPKSQTR